MYVINTKGFQMKDKISISRDYLLPELLETFLFTDEEIQFTDDTLEYIIEKFTQKEEGVRNLKRCLETIISKINIYYLSKYKEKDDKKINLTYTIDDFQLPLKMNRKIIDDLLKIKTNNNPPEHMYM